MVMEVGQPLSGSRWTSTSAHPFGPAPGAGRGLGLGYTSGFSATPADEVFNQPGAEQIVFQEDRIEKVTGIEIRSEAVKAGEIPSLVLRLRYTDRGGVNKSILDAQVKGLFKKSGYKTSRATSFKPVNVVWRWQKLGSEASGDRPIYVPVVASGPHAGLRYAGSAYPEPLYDPSAKALANLPNQLWIYTIAVTSAQNTMTDGDGAQVITLLKQAIVNMYSTGGVQNTLATRRGCPRSVFEKPVSPTPAPIKGAVSALILLAAYNMVAPHIGSERL